jgi:hypothetical protein
VKYGSKIFSEPDVNKKAKGGRNPKLYVSALHYIFLSMKGLRIFERFGFDLPKKTKFLLGPGLSVIVPQGILTWRVLIGLAPKVNL